MNKLSLVLGCVAVAVFAMGCKQTDPQSPGTTFTTTQAPADDHAGHDHAATDHAAPHGGHLIELGHAHEFHAELLDDHKTATITIYLLDADLKPLSNNAATVSVVLSAGENTETFDLLASQPGSSAEFKSSDAKMMAMIDGEKISGKLRVTLDAKPYTGSFEHLEHGQEGEAGSHEGHDH